MDHESENSFTSQLPRASRLPAPKKLTELTSSAVNSRSTDMPPPPVNGLKRKTLAERGGEPIRTPAGPKTNKNINASAKSSSIAGPPYQQLSYSSSANSRPPSAAGARNVSNGSFTSSVGYSNRPIPSQFHRPHSAMGPPRLNKLLTAPTRPASSMEAHTAPSNGRVLGKRKGRTQFSSTLIECPEHTVDFNGSPKAQMKPPSNWESIRCQAKSLRDISLSNAMSKLSLENSSPEIEHSHVSVDHKGAQNTPITLNPQTPSHLPRPVHAIATPAQSPSPSKAPKKKNSCVYLNRHSNLSVPGFDADDCYGNMEGYYTDFKDHFNGAAKQSNGMTESITIYKKMITELEATRRQLLAENTALITELNNKKTELSASAIALEDFKRNSNITLEDLQRHHNRELEQAQWSAEEELHRLERRHAEETECLTRRRDTELSDERAQFKNAVQQLNEKEQESHVVAETKLVKQQETLQALDGELGRSKADLECERNMNSDLKVKLSEAASNAIRLEGSVRSLRAHIEFLESDNKSQSRAFADLDSRLQNAIKAVEEAKDKLRAEETLRRKLHNQVQELKGNIRVYCRVRPTLDSDSADESARIAFPDNSADARELEVSGPEEKNSLGKISTRTNAFSFDRVFAPDSMNAEVYGEISQLVQSALDGYNVCIFCYGQTGSGKTYTMSAKDGMIPRAVHHIYDTAKSLEERGWKYTMEGSFIEVYNENLNDLLGKPDEYDKKKHDIRHDMQKCKTTITDITTVALDTPEIVEAILRRASSNRSVAATKANERSSRSHSVFILKLTGENSTTGEKSEGTLNLVDLAGSERISQSGATGERLKETQNINKSLSCLGDVIGALGQGKEGVHIPYRNSKVGKPAKNSQSLFKSHIND
ncbi:MAG: hypothetical protein Q9167_002137 [Letrouitia subvulpina]